MNKLLHFALCSILLTSTVLVSAQEPTTDAGASSVKGVRRALLVAVSKYAKGFSELPSVDNDVKLMKDELLNSGFKEQHIRVLQHSGIMPTRDNIKDAVQELAASCGSEDLAFIMLTGHGLRNEKTRKDFFLPLDAKASDFNTFVPLDFVIDALESSKAKFKWILVDACRSTGKGPNDGNGVGRLTPKPGMLIFQSCSPGEVSYFTDDDQYGLFVYNFVEGLRGGAIDDCGRVSVLGAFTYACNKIESRQHPVTSSKDFTDFVLTENDEWTLGANFYRKALESIDAGDFIQAQKNVDLAIALKTPLESVYRKKAETIKVLVNASIKTDEKIGESIEPEPSNVSSSNQSNPTNASTDAKIDWETGKAGDRRVIMVDGIEFAFRYCPAGRHTIGSPESEEGRDDDETQHEVIFSHPYWMLETEVTQEMWEKVMGSNPSYFKGSDLPVERVSWNDCQEFIQKLNEKGVAPSGWVFSLPTEAEWEAAARADSTTAFSWGNALNGDEANCDGIYPYGTETKDKSLDKTCAVKSYSPNAWGLYDTAGNVWEWCLDNYGKYPKTAETDYVCKEGSWRVHRGGSWSRDAQLCRSSFRLYNSSSFSVCSLGFRCSLASALVRRPVEIETVDVSASPTSSGGTPLDASLSGDVGVAEQGGASTDWETGKAGDRRVIMVDGIEFTFRYCPAGRHTIGSAEESRSYNETQHEVIFSHPYWMMETEVTQEMWKKVMGSNPSYFKGSNLPVEQVSWNDCQDFIQKLNEKGLTPSGWVFSLPTKAEWEVAARAGSTTAFPWGDVLNGDKANCNANCSYGTDIKGKFLEGTCAVKSYSPNAWGLYDTAGNVEEWCLDKYFSESTEAEFGFKGDSSRVCRGGSFCDDAEYCQSSYLNEESLSFRCGALGFRCALVWRR